jgi:hypothetical protein
MKNSLSDFIAELNRNKNSGLLSIPVKGANKLLKLFFREGELYYVACGDSKGWSCVAQAGQCDVANYFYMPDASFNLQDNNLPALQDIIQYFKSASTAVDPGAGVKAAGSAQASGTTVASPAVLDAITLALTRQIGPAGGKVVKRIVEQQWHPASPPSKADYAQLIDVLKNEVENPDDRGLFIKEARELLS